MAVRMSKISDPTMVLGTRQWSLHGDDLSPWLIELNSPIVHGDVVELSQQSVTNGAYQPDTSIAITLHIRVEEHRTC